METQEKNGMKFLRVAPCVMPAVFAALTLLCYLLPAATLMGISMGNVYALAAEGEPFARLLLWSGIAVTVLGGILTAISFLPAVKESKKNKLWGSEWIAYISAVLYLIALIVGIIATIKIKDLMIFSTGVGVILAIVLDVVFLACSVLFTVLWRKKNGESFELAKARERFDAYKAECKPLQMERPRVESTETMTKLSGLLRKKCIQCIWQWILFAVCIYLFVYKLMESINVIVTEEGSGGSESVEYLQDASLKEYWGLIIAVALGVAFTAICILKQTWALKRVKADVFGYILTFLTLGVAFFLRSRVLGGRLFVPCALILLIIKFIIQGDIKKIVKADTYKIESSEYEAAVKAYVEEKKKYREYKSFKRAEYALGGQSASLSE